MKRLRKLRCFKCGRIKWEKFSLPAEDTLNAHCPDCGTFPMLVKMRVKCMNNNCKKFVIVEGDSFWNNWNFHNNNGINVDIRNQGYVCPEHTDKKL